MTAASDAARSFDAWAAHYDRYRPPYPEELFELIATRLALPERPLVADLGAGTGRAALAMAALGWRVTAIDPGGPMLDVLRGRASDEGLLVATVVAPAEETGLDAASVDLATAAQSFHWFDRPRAVVEMARIVRPGGGIALFWNVRDVERSPVWADYHRLLREHGVKDDQQPAGPDPATPEAISRAGGFEAIEFDQVPHRVTLAAGEFTGLAFTASYVRALEADRQARLADALAGLADRYWTAPDAAIALPYTVDLWTARRKES